MCILLWIAFFVIVIGVLAFRDSSLRVWTLALVCSLLFFSRFSGIPHFFLVTLWGLAILILTISNIPLLRQQLITSRLFGMAKRLIPEMSETEKQALEAGSVGFEGEIFSGHPNWENFFARPSATLSAEEQDFLNGPVEQLCAMISDWQITHEHLDMTPEMWQFLKENRFFAMIIPKQYGGLEFSHWAHACVLMKVFSASSTVASTISVPNSLGPAELLLDYGTDKQKEYYLPRLACGDEIPCFGLTAPTAGSDAAAIPDIGVVCQGEFEGESIIGIRLNFSKRYITLAPIASLIGLAFKLEDPEHLLGSKSSYGITVALIPAVMKGITKGRRHFPLNIAFLNGPIQGHDVFIPVDWIIGGVKMAGQGWRMLMERLATGRAISLPSGAVGGSRACAYASGAYARIRKQFKMSIARFEGVEEKLAAIAGNTYLIDAVVRYTLAALDQGEQPAVATAIVKYHATETARKIINDAMDIHGGKGICMGPKNYLARSYQGMPISITVEGANILTRNMIIFGQGATRCHPYLQQEMQAVAEHNLQKFDQAVFGHIGYVITVKIRTLYMGLFGKFIIRVPTISTAMYLRSFTRYSAALAFASNVSLLTLGGQLKRKERISARLGDILSYLYIGSCVIKRYMDEGRNAADMPLVDWSCQTLLFQIEAAFSELIDNFPNRFLRFSLRSVIFPLGKYAKKPSDALERVTSRILLSANPSRDRLCPNLAMHANHDSLTLLNNTLAEVIEQENSEFKVQKAVAQGEIHAAGFAEQVRLAQEQGILTGEEAEKLLAMDKMRSQVIAVDDFSEAELTGASRF